VNCGIVVIGRNEGARLEACLRASKSLGVPCLYVDSGSSDGSPRRAADLGVPVLELDPARPFSAARARNEGFERLRQVHPGIEAVQFVDGDSELMPGWLEAGLSALGEAPQVTVVCGRVEERHPEASPYNRLCALEWQKEPGEILACGGIFMVRAEAFEAVGGFRVDVIAAEDDELCLRLRRRGGRILCLAAGMAWHDADLLTFGQWWRRTRRAGHAFAQGSHLHGGGSERHFVANVRRILVWALAIPAIALGLAWPTHGLSLLLLGLYPLQSLRIYRSGRARGWARHDAALFAVFVLLGKFPELAGVVAYAWRRHRCQQPVIIEHKRVGSPS
jgi:GT2 family glycosyltransferase